MSGYRVYCCEDEDDDDEEQSEEEKSEGDYLVSGSGIMLLMKLFDGIDIHSV